ncbi:MAG: cytochrome ubiquinol oxidase subunit I [Vicinamibacterales bacterium]
MDAVTLARWQFGITTVYHFFFVPLTLGLVWVVALLQTAWVVSGRDVYLRLTKFWGKLFLINFAMGVATGIVQEFQFGMNWSEYSRFVGDVFGAPLAIEALLAFFLESTFLGLWIFGWERLPKRLHLASIWLVAIGSNISALWILIANSFMQQPMGYVLRNGRAEMNDFLALITNPHVFVQFPHVLTGAMATAAFFMLGISAWRLLRTRDEDDVEAFGLSFRIGAVYGLVATVAVMAVGHNQAQYMVRIQPMKMAAAEALWETENPAAMSLFTVGDEDARRDVFAIKVPGLLSFLAYNRFEGEVKGINELQQIAESQFGPGDYVPPVKWTYWTFRIMIGAGLLMLLAALWATADVWRDRVGGSRLLMRLLPAAIALPYIANSAGWIFTEIGRQPWIVFGLQRTVDAVSPTVTVAEVFTSLVGFTLLYGALMVADVFLLAKYARAGASGAEIHPVPPADVPAAPAHA